MKSPRISLLALSPQIWFFTFFGIPLSLVLIVSFLKRGLYGGIEFQLSGLAYEQVFQTKYLQILGSSVLLALSTTVICILLSVPISWAIATSSAKNRFLLLVAVILPFFINLIVRIYSLKLLVQVDGPLDKVFNYFKILHDPFSWDQNMFMVLFGMVTTYLPFMIFPLYGAFEKFDFTLVEAAYDLGAGTFSVLRSVLIPGLRMALISGSLMVFIPALGEFVIPDLLGGAKTMLMGGLITEQFLKARDWPVGAALTVVLLIFLLLGGRGIYSNGEKS